MVYRSLICSHAVRTTQQVGVGRPTCKIQNSEQDSRTNIHVCLARMHFMGSTPTEKTRVKNIVATYSQCNLFPSVPPKSNDDVRMFPPWLWVLLQWPWPVLPVLPVSRLPFFSPFFFGNRLDGHNRKKTRSFLRAVYSNMPAGLPKAGYSFFPSKMPPSSHDKQKKTTKGLFFHFRG